MEFKGDFYVLLYSKPQDTYIVDTMIGMVEKNTGAFIRGRSSDYMVIAIADTRESLEEKKQKLISLRDKNSLWRCAVAPQRKLRPCIGALQFVQQPVVVTGSPSRTITRRWIARLPGILTGAISVCRERWPLLAAVKTELLKSGSALGGGLRRADGMKFNKQ